MALQLHQNLYERYSTLELTYDTDMPNATAGLEKRLLECLNSTWGYGILQSTDVNSDYFHRGLL
jgi:hypothetical protein